MQHNSDTKTDGAKDWSEILARITSLANIICSLHQELRNERAQKANEKKVLQQQTENLRQEFASWNHDLCSIKDKPTSPKRNQQRRKKETEEHDTSCQLKQC